MADGTEKPSLWLPITNRIDLACLGKLGEESAELSGIVLRTIIQGIDEVDPDTGKVNRLALAEEIADVRGLSQLVSRRYNLDPSFISERAYRKAEMKREWFRMIARYESEVAQRVLSVI